MAIPKVFVSSTCFDLAEVRDQLNRFIHSYGFEPILSEYGDVFYHPDLHTHESCVHEVVNCQLFILIIGGRFGGEYISDKTKSITNAEYDAAREKNIPIFTYVRNSVLSNQHIYKENKTKEFVSEIEYPAIDKQEYATDIFDFIDNVRKSPQNNALEGFENFIDIESHLRKQWAGMFFDFLKTREVKSQIDATNHMLGSISSSSVKLEELVKSLYRTIAKDTADESINSVEILNTMRRFFSSVSSIEEAEVGDIDYFGSNDVYDIENIAKISPKDKSWHQYLSDIGLFEYEDFEEENGEKSPGISRVDREYGFVFGPNFHHEKESFYKTGVLISSEEQRLKVLKEFIN